MNTLIFLIDASIGISLINKCILEISSHDAVIVDIFDVFQLLLWKVTFTLEQDEQLLLDAIEHHAIR